MDSFLTISPGSVLAPGDFPGFADSVDGDGAGIIDGSGTDGYSWFNGFTATTVTVTFSAPVASAGLVFTDGEEGAKRYARKRFDTSGALLSTINAGALADSTFTGETAEDHFLGFRSNMIEIGSITLTTSPPPTGGAGDGIEIDHVHWSAVPEPSAFLFLGLFAIASGIRRKVAQLSQAQR